MRGWFALLLATACGAGNASVKEGCPPGRTMLDGVCVSDGVADYVGCVRAQGAQLGEERAKKLSAEVGIAGQHAAAASEVKEKLQKQYSASDANVSEVIKGCSELRSEAASRSQCAGFNQKMVSTCGFEPDPNDVDCETSVEYRACLQVAGESCQAMSLCGYKLFSTTHCAGAGIPAGSDRCAATTACQEKCNGAWPCICDCTAKMDPGVAHNVGLQNQCHMVHCADCGKAGKPGCGECFTQHCAAKYEKWCRGS